MLINLAAFGGMKPKLVPHLLPESAAQFAMNCMVNTGALIPLMGTSFVNTPAKVGDISSIYRLENIWLHWLSDVDVIEGAIAEDRKRTYFTGDGVPKITDEQLAILGGGAEYPTISYTLGVPPPETAMVLSLSGVATETDDSFKETRIYVYTFVTEWGEEGQPSAASGFIDVLPGQNVDITGMDGVPAGSPNIATKRIYRTISGSVAAEFQFVAEIPVAQTTYSDSLNSADLVEILPSQSWEMPPSDLHSLTYHPNGFMVGASGKAVYFSVPYYFHAWPSEYSLTVDDNIVAIGSFGVTTFLLTGTSAYACLGITPDYITMERIGISQGCVSKRSVTAMDGGLCYASPDGLCVVSSSSASIATSEILTREQWQAYKPESMLGVVHDSQYFGFYDTGIKTGCIIIDLTNGSITESDIHATAAWNDDETDTLYLVVGGNIVSWNTGDSLTYTWQSKDNVSGNPINMSAARVIADAYPVTIKVYADRVLSGTYDVLDGEVFRLNGNTKSRTWSMAIEGGTNVTVAQMSTNVSELR